MEQVVELVPFLRDPKKEVRHIAVKNLAGFSSSQEAQELLAQQQILIPTLKILLCDVDYIAREAYVCLLQFSTNTAFAFKMLESKLVPHLMEVVCDKDSLFIEVALLILANLTRIHEGSESLLQKDTEFEGVFVYKLIQKFCQGEKIDDGKLDKYKWIASIVTNLSQLEKGRHILTKDGGELLMLIASANISDHPIRRRGIASTIKNCCFNREKHMELLNKGLLNFIVVPLMAGPENYTPEEVDPMPIAAKTVLMKDHKMETDKETIMSLIEALVLLCSSKETRTYLRDVSLYPIVREFDNRQRDEEIKEEILKVVNFLVRDEAKDKSSVVEVEEDEEDLKIQEFDLD